MSGVMEFLGWVFVFFIVFSLMFTPGGLAVLILIAATGLLLLPFVVLAQVIALGKAVEKEKEE